MFEKQKVYVVEYSSYDGGHVSGIFSDKKMAEIWKDKLNKQYECDPSYESYDVVQYEIDSINPNLDLYRGYVSNNLEFDCFEICNGQSYETEPRLCVGDKRYSIMTWAKNEEEAKDIIIKKYKEIK